MSDPLITSVLQSHDNAYSLDGQTTGQQAPLVYSESLHIKQQASDPVGSFCCVGVPFGADTPTRAPPPPAQSNPAGGNWRSPPPAPHP